MRHADDVAVVAFVVVVDDEAVAFESEFEAVLIVDEFELEL